MKCAHGLPPQMGQEVWAMESPKRKRNWIPKVARDFEGSRLESQLVALAYEQVLPLVQHRGASQRRLNELEETVNVQSRSRRSGTGA